MHEDYLCHYGVKGMKWGRRKKKYESERTKSLSNASQFHSTRAAYKKAEAKRLGTSKSAAKAKRASAYANEAKRTLKESKSLDAKVSNWKSKASRGERALNALLYSPMYGSHPYAEMRATGVSRGKAIMKSLTLEGAMYGDSYVEERARKRK